MPRGNRKNGPDTMSGDELFQAILKPHEIGEVNRGHFALLFGKLVAQDLCTKLLILNHLTEAQRKRLDSRLDRGQRICARVVKERERRGESAESILQAKGSLEGIQRLREYLIG